jgi:hypothetical protein
MACRAASDAARPSGERWLRPSDRGAVVKKWIVRWAAPVGTAALLLPGCFSYRTAELATVSEGSHVRVHMTRVGFASLPEIPNQSGPRLVGTLAGRNGEDVLLRVPIGEDALDGTIAQQVSIPTGAIVAVERRQLSRTRTAIAIAGGVATAVALYLGFEKGKPFQAENPEEPEEEAGMTVGVRRFLRLSIRFP